MARSLGRRVAASLGLVAVVIVVMTSGVLPKAWSTGLDDASQWVGALAASFVCWRTARHRSGAERRWRLLMAAGLTCWSTGVLIWALYRSVLDIALPSPSYADFGFFLFPIFAVPALLSLFRRNPRTRSTRFPQGWATSVLDGMVVVGSLFVLSWATVLGHVARSESSDALQFLVALMYPVTDVVLLGMVGLLVVIPGILRRYGAQLVLLGLGLVCFSLSDSIFVYLVAAGAEEMPLLADAGFILGPVLIALAASAPPVGPYDPEHEDIETQYTQQNYAAQPLSSARRSWLDRLASERTQLLVPYGLLSMVGFVVVMQWIFHGATDPVVLALFLIVVVLSLVRQIVTLLQNEALLRRLSSAQSELLYRAHHDGLTGLLNRSAFDDRLETAIHLHNTKGEVGVLLLIDLDDFKTINDRLGHAAGDRSLKILARRLAESVEEGGNGGVVARFGGDEFTVLIPAGLDEGCRTARLIVDALRQPQDIEGHNVTIGASIGVVELDIFEDAVSADAMLRNADRAMYEAKKNGKAGVYAYDCDRTLRMVYNPAEKSAPFDWWGGRNNMRTRGNFQRQGSRDIQGKRGINPNIVAGEPDPARLIGPPTRT